MGGYHSFYRGADYGLNPDYGSDFEQSVDYIPTRELSLTTDPRTANQLKETAGQIRSGTKAVEIEMISPDVVKAIPEQHLEELNRLRKLAGVELTLHGPLIEPTGVSQQGWDETQRVHAEREIWQAIERGHSIQPDGKMVVTLHTSAGLPEPEIREKIGNKEVTTNIAVVDERTGKLGYLPQEGKEHFEKTEELSPEEKLKVINNRMWNRQINELTLAADRGRQEVERAISTERPLTPEQEKKVMKMYSMSIKEPYKYQEEIQDLRQKNPELANVAEGFTNNMGYGRNFIRNAYENFRESYNEAYDAAERTNDKKTLKKLEEFRKKVAPRIEKFKDNPEKTLELANEISRGVGLLSEITPQVYRPLKDFAIDKASDTFSNVAFNAYRKFKDKAPVIALENPPIGTGLARGEEIRTLVEETQKKLAQKLQEEKGFSKGSAEKEARKLIGVTWDVGHINMLRKYGYENADLKKETEKIAKHVKKIHLSDNFGFEHSELPMGMGNVPMNEHMAVLKQAHKKKLKEIKKVIEAGDWYQHFKTTPFSVFGNPIYPMKMAPYWETQTAEAGSYFAGYGLNPEVHHSMYGTGFSTLPTELGGQMSGRSRLSGSPIE